MEQILTNDMIFGIISVMHELTHLDVDSVTLMGFNETVFNGMFIKSSVNNYENIFVM